MKVQSPKSKVQSPKSKVAKRRECAVFRLHLTRIWASPAGRKKIAHRFIGGLERARGTSPVRDGRVLSSLAGLAAPPGSFVPTDESVGYFLSPCRAGPDAFKVQAFRRFGCYAQWAPKAPECGASQQLRAVWFSLASRHVFRPQRIFAFFLVHAVASEAPRKRSGRPGPLTGPDSGGLQTHTAFSLQTSSPDLERERRETSVDFVEERRGRLDLRHVSGARPESRVNSVFMEGIRVGKRYLRKKGALPMGRSAAVSAPAHGKIVGADVRRLELCESTAFSHRLLQFFHSV